MAYRYAERTKVSTQKSEAEIRALLRKHGAVGFMIGEQAGSALIAFEMKDRRLKFIVPMPVMGRGTTENKVKQETRRRYRALALVLKAKLEAVESKIVEFETEFLAHIVFDGNTTVGERMIPQLRSALEDKELPPLLGNGS